MYNCLRLARLPMLLGSALVLAGCQTMTFATDPPTKQYVARLCADPKFWPDWKPSRSDTAQSIEEQTASRAGRKAFCEVK